MKRYLAISVAAAALTLSAAGASAQSTTINFETGAPGGFAQTSPLTTRYAALGVTFSGVGGPGGSILNDGSFGALNARSGTDFLAFNAGAPTALSERLTFSTPITSFSIFLGALNGGSTFTATGFGADGLALATSFATTVSNGQYANLTLGGFNFSQVVFSSTSGIFAADDLSFSTAAVAAAVPEPATWAMMIIGFGLAGFALRRRPSKVTTRVQFA